MTTAGVPVPREVAVGRRRRRRVRVRRPGRRAGDGVPRDAGVRRGLHVGGRRRSRPRSAADRAGPSRRRAVEPAPVVDDRRLPRARRARWPTRSDIGQFAVWGYSGGGPYAVACAALLPDRVPMTAVAAGMGQVGVWATIDESEKTDRQMLRLSTTHPALARFLLGASGRGARISPKIAMKSFEKQLNANDREVVLGLGPPREVMALFTQAFLRGAYGVVADYAAIARPWGFDVESIESPMAIFHGDADTMVPAAPRRGAREAGASGRADGVARRRAPRHDHPRRGHPRRAGVADAAHVHGGCRRGRPAPRPARGAARARDPRIVPARARGPRRLRAARGVRCPAHGPLRRVHEARASACSRGSTDRPSATCATPARTSSSSRRTSAASRPSSSAFHPRDRRRRGLDPGHRRLDEPVPALGRRLARAATDHRRPGARSSSRRLHRASRAPSGRPSSPTACTSTRWSSSSRPTASRTSSPTAEPTPTETAIAEHVRPVHPVRRDAAERHRWHPGHGDAAAGDR